MVVQPVAHCFGVDDNDCRHIEARHLFLYRQFATAETAEVVDHSYNLRSSTYSFLHNEVVILLEWILHHNHISFRQSHYSAQYTGKSMQICPHSIFATVLIQSEIAISHAVHHSLDISFGLVTGALDVAVVLRDIALHILSVVFSGAIESASSIARAITGAIS